MSYDFDGTDDYMEGSIVTTNVPVTLSAWFNSDITNSARIIFAIAEGSILAGTTLSPSLSVRTSGTATVTATTSAGNGTNNSSSANTFAANTWNHVAGRFSGTASRIVYLNGEKATENTGNRATGGTLNKILIGRGSAGTYLPSAPFNGRLAEIAIWNVALDDDEIISLSKGIKPTQIRPQSLEYYVPLIRDINETIAATSLTSSGPLVFAHTRRYG